MLDQTQNFKGKAVNHQIKEKERSLGVLSYSYCLSKIRNKQNILWMSTLDEASQSFKHVSFCSLAKRWNIEEASKLRKELIIVSPTRYLQETGFFYSLSRVLKVLLMTDLHVWCASGLWVTTVLSCCLSISWSY